MGPPHENPKNTGTQDPVLSCLLQKKLARMSLSSAPRFAQHIGRCGRHRLPRRSNQQKQGRLWASWLPASLVGSAREAPPAP